MTTFSIIDIQNDDIQHNDIQHNDIQHNDAQHNTGYYYAKCRLCYGTLYSVCRYPLCRYAECRGAKITLQILYFHLFILCGVNVITLIGNYTISLQWKKMFTAMKWSSLQERVGKLLQKKS